MKDIRLLKRIFSTIKEFLLKYIITTVAVSCRNFCIVFLGAYISSAAITAASNKNIHFLYKQSFVFITLLVLFVLLDSIFTYMQKNTIHQILMQYRHKIYEQALYSTVEDLNKIGGRSEVLSRLNQDTMQVISIFSYGIVNMLMYIISGIGATISIFMVDWHFAICLYLFGIISTIINIVLSKNQRKIYKLLQEKSALSLKIFSEQIHNSLNIKMMGLNEYTEKLFKSSMSAYDSVSIKDAQNVMYVNELATINRLFQYIGVILLGLVFYQQHIIKIGDIVFVAELSALIITMITSIGDAYSSIQKSLAGYERIEEIINIPPEKLSGLSVSMEKGNELISVKSAGIRFENKLNGFWGISFHAPQNKLIALVGASGSGKTTFLKVLLGLYQYTEGEIYLWGQDVSLYDKNQLRDNIAFVPQEDLIIEGSIKDNLLLGVINKNISTEEINTAIQIACADEWIYNVGGFNTYLGEGGYQISGGQRQSLAIARALLRKSPLLLLDEAFAGIDEMKIISILKNIKRLSNKRNLSTIVVTHDSKVLKECDITINLNEDGVSYGGK